MIKSVFFDLNETLTNTELLGATFKKYFKDESVSKYWFSKLLHTSVIMGSMESYKNFGELGKHVLDSVAFEYNVNLSEEEKVNILSSFKALPPHKDVIEAMKMLRENSIRVIVVSNSSLEMIGLQLANAGIIDFVDEYYSVDAVSRYKPFKEVYNYVADQESLKPEEVMMIACHDWDLFGAKKAGLKTGYIKRKKTIYNPFYEQPDLQSDSLIEIATSLIYDNK
ncbi:MAG TPA: haloacid dehalogenase type II [Clostridia bacterium]|nr:haloacid dehalogenase type II [Clostridia bacterium]